MKKYLLSSLLIIMMSLVWAKSHFLDMRVGDFGCVTRVVFEFTGKIDYNITEEENNISIFINSLNESTIHLPIEASDNINSILVSQTTGSAKVDLDFTYPIEVTSYNYFQESKNYVIVVDIYDDGYKTDKNKALATLLFKGQKFPLDKISSEINEFSLNHSTDPLVNLYLGRLFARKKMKSKALEYFNKISEGSEHFLTAQAYIDNLGKNKYPTDEVKPDFLVSEQEPITVSNPESENNQVNNLDINNDEEVSSKDEKIAENANLVQEQDKRKSTPTKTPSNKIWFIILGISLIIIILQFIQLIKKKILVRELNTKLEGSIFELRALENKLEKGVIENSKTKDRIIIKLFNNGWKPQDIANELNTSLDIVEATISKEGRL